MSWSRSVLLLLIGLWIGASLATWVTASLNFHMVERILDASFRPEFSERALTYDRASFRTDLRFLSSELNRWIFSRWGVAQVVLSLAVLALVWMVPRPGRLVAALAATVAILSVLIGFVLTPWIRSIGRFLDFVPRPFPENYAAAGRTFGLLHGAYLIVDMLKVMLLCVLWACVTRVMISFRSASTGQRRGRAGGVGEANVGSQ